ncbi:MAG: right-handed parallel beta-helix repeat-containing protein, partial [Candidatus Thorarchaeota archaeon]
MIRKKIQKCAVIFGIFLTFSILAFTFNNGIPTFTDNFELRDEGDNLQISATYIDIEINALATINTTKSGNWTWAKDNGYCTGFGTPEDPYVIQGHIFDNGGAFDDCLRILNSRVNFIIKDCIFRNSDNMDSGLYLYNVTNGVISNNFMYTCLRGIELIFVNNTEINGNHIYGNTEGLRMSNSHHNMISNNNVSINVNHGMYFLQSTFNTISNNFANEIESLNGITLTSSSDNNIISSNTANLNGENGIDASSCDDLVIQYNTVYGNTLKGIIVDGGANLYCADN